MSVRICPRCSTLIQSGSAIFCYNCGQELDHLDRPISEINSPLAVTKKFPKFLKSLNHFVFFILVIPMLFVVLILSLVYFRARTLLRAPIPLSASANEYESTVSALPISPFNFGKYNFASLAPSDTDLYLESYNPKLFLEKLLDAKSLKSVEAQTGLNLDETTSFFEPEFAYLESSSSAAIIGVAKDLEFLKSRAAKISDPRVKWLAADPFFILASSQTFIKEIEKTSQAKVLALASLAGFHENLKNLPPSGQILIYATSPARAFSAIRIFFGRSLDDVPSFLKGDSLVVTAVDGSVLLRGLSSN